MGNTWVRRAEQEYKIYSYKKVYFLANSQFKGNMHEKKKQWI